MSIFGVKKEKLAAGAAVIGLTTGVGCVAELGVDLYKLAQEQQELRVMFDQQPYDGGVAVTNGDLTEAARIVDADFQVYFEKNTTLDPNEPLKDLAGIGFSGLVAGLGYGLWVKHKDEL